MEYQLTLAGVGAEPTICSWNSESILRLSSVEFHKLRLVLEDFGRRSARAQGLAQPITDIFRIRNSDQRVYLHLKSGPQGTTVYGGIKVGRKKLFTRQDDGAVVEMEPTCVLDFYVHESCQRVGVGKTVFEHFMAVEGHQPERLAYDRPSPKLLAFLRKHYGLASYTPQNNNFVVFHAYFQQQQQQQQTQRQQQQQLSSSGQLDGGDRDWASVTVQQLSPAEQKQLPGKGLCLGGWPHEHVEGNSPTSRSAGCPTAHVPLTWQGTYGQQAQAGCSRQLQHNDALDSFIRYEDREQRPPLSAGVSGSSGSCMSPGSSKQDPTGRSFGRDSSTVELSPYACAKPVWSAASNQDGTYRPRAPWAPTQPRFETAPPAIQPQRQDSGLGFNQPRAPPPPTHTVLSAALAAEVQQAQLSGSGAHYSTTWGSAGMPMQPALSSQRSSRRTSRDARDSAAFQRGGAGAASCMRYG